MTGTQQAPVVARIVLPRMHWRVVMPALALTLSFAAAPVNAQSPDPVTGMTWLSGCWAQTTGARVVEEFWQAPRGGMMMGMGRTTNGPRLVEFEYMRIEGRGDTLVFVALPSGQKSAEFRARPPFDTEVVFENLAHDFPQRVRYRRVGRDSVHARVEGMQSGAVRGFDFRYGRVSCPSGESSRR